MNPCIQVYPGCLDGQETPDNQNTQDGGLLAVTTGMIRVDEQRYNFHNSMWMRLIPVASGTAVCP